MAIKSFKVEKLIRDKLPRIMKAKGVIFHERVMDREQYIQALKNKLQEESQEVLHAQTSEEYVEELSDVLEVVNALSEALNLPLQKIEEKRIAKRDQNGGFEGRIYNHRVDIDEENHAIQYYLNRSKQYPEIVPRQENCLFCQMAKQVTPFAQLEHCYIIKDQFPVSPGHLLIIPYEHTENWFTASEEVRLDIMKALSSAKELLAREYQPQGYNIGANCGKVAGQTVMHLHMHLIPRYQGDMEDPRGGIRGVIPSKQKYAFKT